LTILIVASVIAVVMETASAIAQDWSRLVHDFGSFSLIVHGTEHAPCIWPAAEHDTTKASQFDCGEPSRPAPSSRSRRHCSSPTSAWFA
jgi:hypothetical protein